LRRYAKAKKPPGERDAHTRRGNDRPRRPTSKKPATKPFELPQLSLVVLASTVGFAKAKREAFKALQKLFLLILGHRSTCPEHNISEKING
jgi:hypothetical protein